MTIRVPSGTSLPIRLNMPALVSPLMPALITLVVDPLACSMAWSCAGQDWEELRPYPAVLLAPSATTCAEAAHAEMQKPTIAICTTTIAFLSLMLSPRRLAGGERKLRLRLSPLAY